MRPGRHLAAAALRPLLLLTLNATRHVRAHAPTYAEECHDNCCKPKRDDHTFSQAFYLQGSGGVELHLDDIDIAGGETLHWDVVFRGNYRERPSSSDYELYVGCGGCVSGDPYWPASKLPPAEVLTPVLEPFTSTSYYPLYDKDDPIREFNAKVLENCDPDEKHFTIRLRSLTSEPLFWAPVVGCPEFRCELPAFGAYEIFVFPYYILHNQRGAWSEYYEGLWIALGIATLIVALVFLTPRFVCYACATPCIAVADGCGERGCHWCRPCCGPRDGENEATLYGDRPDEDKSTQADRRVCAKLLAPWKTMCTRIADHAEVDAKGYAKRTWSLRGILYTVAVWSMLASLANATVNIVHSLDRLDPPYEYEGPGMGMFIGMIVIWGHVLPLILVAIIWWKATNVAESRWRSFYYGGARDGRCANGKCCANYCNCRSPFWAHGCWSVVEVLFVGLAGFFCLGTGLYICPSAITVAGCWRCFGWCFSKRYRRGYKKLRAEDGPGPEGEGEGAGEIEITITQGASARLPQLPPLSKLRAL